MTNEELAKQIWEGNDDLIPQLWENLEKLFLCINKRTVKLYGEKIRLCGVTIEDLTQECFFIMLKTIRAYNLRCPEQVDFRFSTYISLQYKSHIRCFLGIDGQCKARDVLNNRRLELDSDVFDDNETTLIEMIKDENAEKEYRRFENEDYCKTAVTTAKNLLNEKQWDLINRYYLEGQTQERIAQDYGITGSAIQFKINDALRKLRRSQKMRNVLEVDEYRHIGVKSYMISGSIEERILELKESLRKDKI